MASTDLQASPSGARAFLREHGVALAPLGCIVLLYGIVAVVKDLSGVERVTPFDFQLALLAPESVAPRSTHLLSKLNWGTSAVVYFAAWCASVYMMFLTICRVAVKGRVLRAPKAPWVGLGALVIGIALAYGNPMTITPLRQVLNQTLDFTLGAYGHLSLDAANALGISTALLLAVTASICLWVPPDAAAPRAAQASDLCIRLRMMDRCLYAGAAVLVTAVFHAYAVHVLPVPYLGPEDEKVLTGLARGVTTAQGTLWTVTLLAIYLPAASILRRWARHVAESGFGSATAPGVPEQSVQARVAAATHQEQVKWLQENGLDASLAGQLKSLAASLAPLLAGSAAVDVLKVFSA
jgi:hypothetical protein